MNLDDDLPEGIAPDILAAARTAPLDEGGEGELGCDAYALWAAMTRLGHEVKLQGRAFAALRDQLAGDKMTGEAGREAERRVEAAKRRADQAEEDLLSTLADVHDRLARSLDVARNRIGVDAPRAGWFSKLFLRKGLGTGSAAIVDSLVEGQELALRRVTDELARRGVREIPVLGERFNPESMRATATDASGAAPDGMVTAVVRGGWMKGDVVWRVAEVTVARKVGKSS